MPNNPWDTLPPSPESYIDDYLREWDARKIREREYESQQMAMREMEAQVYSGGNSLQPSFTYSNKGLGTPSLTYAMLRQNLMDLMNAAPAPLFVGPPPNFSPAMQRLLREKENAINPKPKRAVEEEDTVIRKIEL